MNRARAMAGSAAALTAPRLRRALRAAGGKG